MRRPKLSPSSAQRIAAFVADTLLEALRQREDLDSETASAIEKAVHRRLENAAPERSGPAGGGDEEQERPIDKAARLNAAGQLDETLVTQSVASGNRRFVNAALAVLADLPLDIVREIVASESAKAVTALAWKAGLSMRFAVELQMRHAGIQPK